VLWLFMVASVMLFASFTSAYIVRRGEGNWLSFELPSLFTYNTVIIVLSSIFMQWAFFAAKKDELRTLRVTLFLTLALGITFTAGQWFAWKQLVANQIFLSGTPSESFVYVISGMHFMHVVVGLFFLVFVLWQTFHFRVHKKSTLSINLCATFWHFLGVLWIYLYFFLLFNR
jgi:cytochrome c oxidase subunit 3